MSTRNSPFFGTRPPTAQAWDNMLQGHLLLRLFRRPLGPICCKDIFFSGCSGGHWGQYAARTSSVQEAIGARHGQECSGGHWGQTVQEAIGARHGQEFHICSGGHWGQTRSGVPHRRERAPTVSETRSELRCTTYTDASPLRRLHTASASRNPDDWTKVVRKEPAGPEALWVVGLYVTSGQGLPGSRKAWRAGPVPVWHSRVVSGARASARAGNVLPIPPLSLSPYQNPPRRRLCQHGFPFPFQAPVR
jgi:hypothetical protein